MGNSQHAFIRESSPFHSPTYDGSASFSLIYDREGNRKYLTKNERRAFLTAADQLSAKARTLCLLLAYSGARLSEVLALTPARVDAEACIVIFESLKKRRRGIFRAVPLPPSILNELERVHHLQHARQDVVRAHQPIWGWGRTIAWVYVKAAMAAAGIIGPQASPKGLRHAFAVIALQSGVPINFVRKWLGHSRLTTTEIYADAVGEEEQHIAARFWKSFK